MARKSAARKGAVKRTAKKAVKRTAKKAVKKAAKKTAKRATSRAAKRPAARAATKTAPKRQAQAKAKATAKARPGVKRARPAAKQARPGVKRAKPRATRKPAARPARDIVVLVGESDIPQIHKVATQLRSRGMKVDSILDATGMITGTSATQPSALSRVKGVTAVEETPPIQLPPPESDIQ